MPRLPRKTDKTTRHIDYLWNIPKGLLLVCMCIFCAAALAPSGTYAVFTDRAESGVMTFTAGSWEDVPRAGAPLPMVLAYTEGVLTVSAELPEGSGEPDAGTVSLLYLEYTARPFKVTQNGTLLTALFSFEDVAGWFDPAGTGEIILTVGECIFTAPNKIDLPAGTDEDPGEEDPGEDEPGDEEDPEEDEPGDEEDPGEEDPDEDNTTGEEGDGDRPAAD